MKRIILFTGVLLIGAFLLAFYLFGPRFTASPERLTRLRSWFNDPRAHAAWSITAGERCGDAVMLLPTNGYIGFGWDDSFRPGHHHSGLDIFGPDDANNVTPIVAAYDGYLTREATWKSTVILRHPDFPGRDEMGVAAGAQIWTYYTHMASADGTVSYVAAEFPPGTYELFVKAGTLLGRQGNWSGSRMGFTGRHLHFSIVKSTADGYADERVLENTFNPAPFLGLTYSAEGILHCATAERGTEMSRTALMPPRSLAKEPAPTGPPLPARAP